MVKIEDSTENAIVTSRGNNVIVPKIEPADVSPNSGAIQLKEEFGASSSSSNVRLQFIEMGFSPNLVDIVLEKNGDDDFEIILNELFTRSALENPGAESSISLEELFNSDNEEETKPCTNYTEKKSYLLSMNFSEQQIDSALQQLGEEAQIEQLIDCIFNFHEENEIKPSIRTDISLDEENNNENLYGVAEKTLLLLQMGFTEQEVSSAIDKFGDKTPVMQLADSILASRMRGSTNHLDDSKEHVLINTSCLKPENGESSFNPSTSNPGFHYKSNFRTSNPDFESKFGTSNPGFHYESNFGTSNPGFYHSNDEKTRPSKRPKKPVFTNVSTYDNRVKDETNHIAPPGASRNVNLISGPPFFIYGNVIPISQETWSRLSQFLYNIQPEFENAQYFSAINRKEGYIHNLPSEKRHYIVPKSPVTIESALPFTSKFWPNWDSRRKFNNIFGTDITGTGTEPRQLCDRLENIVRNSQNLSSEKRNYIAEQCNNFNLIWVGENKLGFLEPHQLERVMGYPLNHTHLFGLDPFDRSKSMKDCFQTDTIGYILSPLKHLFPNGIRILSIYTGLGGAEIALNRLGLRIKCLVSVEASEPHRKILKQWWEITEQKGELVQIGGVSKVTSGKIEGLVKEFGGFDLVVGSSNSNSDKSTGGSSGSYSMLAGMDSNGFFEFVRVVQRVRSAMGSSN